LLKLPPSVRELVVSGRLAMGHARALLGLESDAAIDKLARLTVARDLSVRQVEALVRRERQEAAVEAPKPEPTGPSPAARDLMQRLERALGTRVKVVESDPTRGHLEIQYHSLDQLDGILDKIGA
jgi:ParB family chromosome partitioning protein